MLAWIGLCLLGHDGSVAEAHILLLSIGHPLRHVFAEPSQSSQCNPLLLPGPLVQIAGLCSSNLCLLGHQSGVLQHMVAVQVVHGLCRPQEANQ